jgi:hypothetical protein
MPVPSNEVGCRIPGTWHWMPLRVSKIFGRRNKRVAKEAPAREDVVHSFYPRPTNGIFVAITVMNSTLASGGRPAM